MTNHYKCPECNYAWTKEYECACDSTCPNCNLSDVMALDENNINIEESVINEVKKEPMTCYVDLDSVTFTCPCGHSVCGEGEIISDFIKKHKKHSNGKYWDICTDDGARAWGEKPPPVLKKLPR